MVQPDGDEMSSLFLQQTASIAEAMFVSQINTRIVSPQSNKLLIGQKQDSVAGGYLLTHRDVKIDAMFLIRLLKNSHLVMDFNRFGWTQGKISGKQALSMCLPRISFKGVPLYYKPVYDRYLNYAEDEKQILIELGELKRGYFDKGGYDVQKLIALTQNPQQALDIIFSLQQGILSFDKYHGLSTGFWDIK